MNLRRILRTAALILVLASNLSVNAQEVLDQRTLDDDSQFQRNRNISVSQRKRPEYDAGGVAIGSFTLAPEVALRLAQMDNAFATMTNTIDDTAVFMRPSLRATSNWSKHALQANAYVLRSQFSEQSSENTTDYGLSLGGYADITRDLVIGGEISHENKTEPRSSPNTLLLSDEPIAYQATSGRLNVIYERNRHRFSFRWSREDFNFEDANIKSLGAVDQDFRDHISHNIIAKVERSISPDKAGFARLRWRARDYNEVFDRSRDQRGLNLELGANFDISHVMRGEIGVGHLNYTFEDGVTDDIEGLSVDALVEWFPTPLTTLSGRFSRDVRPSPVAASPAMISAGGLIQADYDMRRNLLLSAGLRYFQDKYQGIGREDERSGFFLRGRYLVNRNIGILAEYTFDTRESIGSESGREYSANTVSIGVRLKR